MTARSLLSLGALFAIMSTAGCVRAPTPPKQSVAGRWTGTIAGVGTMDLTLTQSRGSVNGNGVLTGGDSSLHVAVLGRFYDPGFTLTLVAPGYAPTHFMGDLQGQVLVGQIFGSDFAGESVSLAKR
ncbi:MAG TPA: hypothetical protein VFJ74_09600 [Gemmatimonadaceae bacterium]|nr:hypothetical protein [Gemmatimonadaceae bacterium]